MKFHLDGTLFIKPILRFGRHSAGGCKTRYTYCDCILSFETRLQSVFILYREKIGTYVGFLLPFLFIPLPISLSGKTNKILTPILPFPHKKKMQLGFKYLWSITHSFFLCYNCWWRATILCHFLGLSMHSWIYLHISQTVCRLEDNQWREESSGPGQWGNMAWF